MKGEKYVVPFRYRKREDAKQIPLPGRRFCLFTALLLVLLLMPGIVYADNFVGGLPLSTVQTGTVTGDLYIDATPPFWDNQGTSNINKTFTLPENAVGNITWARLYVSAYVGHMQNDYKFYVLNRWDGNGDGVYSDTSPDFIVNETEHAGFAYVGNTNCNDNSALGGTSCDPFKMINDHETRVTSDYFMWYDVTDKIKSSTVSINVKTAGSFDGRTKVATLVVAYNNASSTTKTTYWVNQGHDVCSYYTETNFGDVAVGNTTFGTAGIGTVSSAVLTVDYMASHNGLYGFPTSANVNSSGNYLPGWLCINATKNYTILQSEGSCTYPNDTYDLNNTIFIGKPPSITFNKALATGSDIQGAYSGVMHWDVTSIMQSFKGNATLAYSRDVSQTGLSAFYKIPLAFLVVKSPLPPSANFTANVTAGTAPLAVQFTDTSTASPTSWSWDFGDGNTSTVQSPVHSYTSAGNYTVTLTATNTGGSNTTARTGYIAVTSAAPVAYFTANVILGTVPLTVQFTDISAGSPTAWNWTFGDGNTSTVQNPVHTYASTGTFTVILTATNSAGSNTTTRTGYITVGSGTAAPVAAFSATPLSGTAPLTVTFTDQSTGNPTGWAWTFGDGSTSTVQNPVHQYTAAGTYTVALAATNNAGSNTATQTGYITVTAGTSGTPVLSLSPRTQSVTVGGSRDYQIVLDSAPDGIAGYYLNVSLATAGVAEISGVAYPSWGQVTNQPTLPNQSILLDATDVNKQVQAGATGIILANITVKGNADGKTAIVISSARLDSDKEGNNTIVPEVYSGSAVVGNYTGPVAGFTADVTSGIAPLTVQFTDTSTNSPTSWSWDFNNDGVIDSTSQNPTVTYNSTGTYSVTLTVTNSGGSDTITKTGYITVTVGSSPKAPVAGFTANVTSGTVPLTVTFTDTSTNSPTSWKWDFNNDGTGDSTTQSPVYTFTSAGTYTVTLTATNFVGSNAVSKTVTVLPVAGFTATPASGTVPLTVAFTDTSTAGTADLWYWEWDFNDGNTSSLENPTHTYSSSGVYTAKLQASVDGSLWSNAATKTITVNTESGLPGVSFYGSPTSGKVPLTVQFTDATSGSPTSWYWTFGDGNTSTEQNPSHTYYTADTYDVTLRATNTKGDNSLTRSSYISVLSASASDCDLTISGSISPVGGAVFAHEPNDVYIYTVKNTGSETCAATTLKLAASDGFSGTAAIPSLSSGGETTVSVTDTTVRSEGKTVTYTATVDPSNTVEETSESNNVKTVSGFTAIWNGYKGKRYMDGGSDVTTQHYYDLNGGIVYDRGNSVYVSGSFGGTWSDMTWKWTKSQPSVPANATVTAAYLYVPYTWDNSNQANSATLTFNGATVSRKALYTDESNFGTYSNYKYGLMMYDVTSTYVKNGENTATFHRSDDWAKISLYEFFLVVVYTDSTKSRKQIFMNEDFDLLGASTVMYGTNETESTAYIPFTGQAVDTSGMQRATLVTFVPSGNGPEGNLIFNGNTIGTKIWDYGGSGTGDVGMPEVAIDSRTVTSYIKSSGNVAEVQSSLDSGTPCMAISQAFLIVNMGPTADFTASPTSGEASLAVTFTDKSTDATSWSWDFGDGYTSTSQNPTHTYTTAGTYDVTLTATSSKGSDTLVQNDYITVTKAGVPSIDFYGTPTSGTVSLTVSFTDESSNYPTSWYWTFGDGSTSTSQNPSHTYTSVGSYDVSLKATNSIGSATATKSDYITVNSASSSASAITTSSATHIDSSSGGGSTSGTGRTSGGSGDSSGTSTTVQSSRTSSVTGQSQAGPLEKSGSNGASSGNGEADTGSGFSSWLTGLVLGALVVVGAGGTVAHVKGYSLGVIAGTIVTGAAACRRGLVPCPPLQRGTIFWDGLQHPERTIEAETGIVRSGKFSRVSLPRWWPVIALIAIAAVAVAAAAGLGLLGAITLPWGDSESTGSFDVIPTVEDIQDLDLTNHAPDYPAGFSAHNGILFVYNGNAKIPLDEIEVDLAKGDTDVKITAATQPPLTNAVGIRLSSYFEEEGNGDGTLENGEWLMVFADSCYDASKSDAEPKTRVIGWHPAGTGAGVEVPMNDTIDYVLKDTSSGATLQEGTLAFIPDT